MTLTSTTKISEITSEFPTLPATKAEGGSGVPRNRFNIPASRSELRFIASFTVVAEITERATIAGT